MKVLQLPLVDPSSIHVQSEIVQLLAHHNLQAEYLVTMVTLGVADFYPAIGMY
jgi:hypothetical protein